MFSEYADQIKKLPEGCEARMALLRTVIKKADEDGSFYPRFYFRKALVHDSVFYDDYMDALREFPTMLQLFDEEAAKGGTDGEDTGELMWAFKWMLSGCEHYYQVTREQFEGFLAEYKKRCIQYGFNLRTYYTESMKLYRHVDRMMEDKAYYEYKKTWRDSLSDCVACDRDSEVKYFLMHGDLEKALEVAEPLLARRLTCGEVPEVTYQALTQYACEEMAKGNPVDEEAVKKWCECFAHPLRYRNIAIEGFGLAMIYYAMTNPSKALTWYKRYWTTFESMRNPTYKFYFAIGAVLFFQKRSKETYKMQLASNFPFYNEENVYNVKQLMQYYYDFAKDYATKRDARNGTSDFMDELNLFCGTIEA